MRASNSRRNPGAPLTFAVLLGVVGIAVAQTNPASAFDKSIARTGVPVESYAWLVTDPTPELPSRPVTSTSDSEAITALESRLRWVGFTDVKADGTWDAATTAAVKRFQWRTVTKATGVADGKLLAKLGAAAGDGDLDPRCLGPGITLCIDKSQRLTRYVKNGEVVRAIETNIGPEKGDKNFGQYSRTREGVFKVFEKKRFAVSTLYGTEMPFWMAFNGGEGFHFSKYFAVDGYKDTSMGCATLNDRAAAEWLFDNTPPRTTVVVHA